MGGPTIGVTVFLEIVTVVVKKLNDKENWNPLKRLQQEQQHPLYPEPAQGAGGTLPS